MIRITRSELRELAGHVILANTPASLFKALERNATVRRLTSEMSLDNLRAYFDRLTERARRTEIELGLSYAVLMASLLHPGVERPLDSDRLTWGRFFDDYAKIAHPSTSLISLDLAASNVRFEYSGSGPATRTLPPMEPATTRTWRPG